MVITDDGRVILKGISWQTYECFLQNYENQSTIRVAYDNGLMEIMSPLVKHEKENRALQDIVTIILETWEWDFVNAGSTTFKKDSESRGFEPDTCFYLNHVEEIRKADHIDIERGDPPPDLVIEIDLTASSLPRNPLFAAVGIPEVWRYSKDELSLLTLTEDGYVERTESIALPKLSVMEIRGWLTDLDALKRPQWTKNIRAWAEANRPAAPVETFLPGR